MIRGRCDLGISATVPSDSFVSAARDECSGLVCFNCTSYGILGCVLSDLQGFNGDGERNRYTNENDVSPRTARYLSLMRAGSTPPWPCAMVQGTACTISESDIYQYKGPSETQVESMSSRKKKIHAKRPD